MCVRCDDGRRGPGRCITGNFPFACFFSVYVSVSAGADGMEGAGVGVHSLVVRFAIAGGGGRLVALEGGDVIVAESQSEPDRARTE